MLLWTIILCLLSASFAATEFAKPELFQADSDGELLPMSDQLVKDDSSEDLHRIRGLLRARQNSCPNGYGQCVSYPSSCCPVGGQCCSASRCCKAGYYCYYSGCCPTGSYGCEGNSCCASGETCCGGGGCCKSGYHCVVVNGQRGCCQNGKTCGVQCTRSGYVPCPGENFCCPSGYKCYRDAYGQPQCGR